MTNLFSIFDPKVFWNLPLNWIASFTLFLIWPIKFWASEAQIYTSLKFTSLSLYKEFNSIVQPLNIPGILLPGVAIFLFIWLNNFLGLFPYLFTSTSHLVITLSLALPVWIGHISIAWVKTTQNILAHLVPMGSPAPLRPFMVLIEIVSAIIRPVTLSVRLAANMVAGHLLIVLLSSPAARGSILLTFFILSTLVILATLERAVATIQAYVFRILSVLYVNEVNSSTLNS